MRPGVEGEVSISCLPGCAPWLRRELESLGLEVVVERETALEVRTDWETACGLCLRLRTALHVLWRVAEVRARDAAGLAARLAELPWEDWIPVSETLTVTSTTDTPAIDNSMFANRMVKDAVVSRIADRRGARPDSGPEGRGVVLSLFWKDDRAWLYLSLSGTKLSDRGYRRIPHLAPMRETVAASLLMASGWDPATPLVVPMCGSGTLAIEGALIASGRAPGLLRSDFGLKHLEGFDPDSWDRLRSSVRAEGGGRQVAPILASDHDPQAVDAARANARTAGVDRLIEFQVSDFADTRVPDRQGMVILHPEYGERMGEVRELEATYRRMGDWMKQALPGWRAAVFTGSRLLAGKIGLKPSRRIPFVNGDIECRLLCFELYRGTRKG